MHYAPIQSAEACVFAKALFLGMYVTTCMALTVCVAEQSRYQTKVSARICLVFCILDRVARTHLKSQAICKHCGERKEKPNIQKTPKFRLRIAILPINQLSS